MERSASTKDPFANEQRISTIAIVALTTDVNIDNYSILYAYIHIYMANTNTVCVALVYFAKQNQNSMKQWICVHQNLSSSFIESRFRPIVNERHSSPYSSPFCECISCLVAL